ncbi:MAG: OB-fold domain-containing protein [Anaerolineaceae bacterium]|nr:OB-fold domain-containing protein [Anaerolineaceae bacterium]
MSNEIQKKKALEFNNLFNWPSGNRLIGTKCKSCGSYYFPKSFTCGNPECDSKEIEEVLFSEKGILWSWTTQYFKPPFPFICNEPYIPYAVGLVEFPEGIKILGIIANCENPDQNLKIDMEMRVIADTLFTDEHGNEVIGWKYSPVYDR